jgi:hypothetical protein
MPTVALGAVLKGAAKGDSQRADTLAAVKEHRLTSRERATLHSRLAEIDLAQWDAAAMHEALASHAREVADDLVELTCILEFIG